MHWRRLNDLLQQFLAHRPLSRRDMMLLIAIYIVVINAWSGCNHRAFGKTLPPTEVGPMRPELVSIIDLSKNGQVQCAGLKIPSLIRSDWNRIKDVAGRLHARNIRNVRRENQRDVCDGTKAVVVERRWSRCLDDLHHTFDVYSFGRWCFPRIDHSCVNDERLYTINWHCGQLFERRYIYPRTFVGHKVTTQVSPLKDRCYRVSDSEQNTYSFQAISLQEDSLYPPPHSSSKVPPWRASLCGLLGLIGTCWGWRNSKAAPWSWFALVCGCLFWAYFCWVLLPWSVGRF
jgi:hypothetical protein